MAQPAATAPPFFSLVQLQSTVSIAIGIVSLLGLLGISMLLVPKAVLVARLRSAERRAAMAEAALADFATGFGALRTEVGALRSDLARVEHNFGWYVEYTTDVVVHFRRRGSIATMPLPREEIRKAFDDSLRARELVSEAAIQGASGVVAGAVPSP